MGDHPRRLDSWKEIAEYLGRDVRTAMRWAKSHGLPVRRVAGGKARSVFAISSEMDAWLAGRPIDTPAGAPEPAAATIPAEPTIPTLAPPPERRRISRGRAAALAFASIGVAAAIGLSTVSTRYPVRVSATATGVAVVDNRGTERIVHAFDPAIDTLFAKTPLITDLDADGTPDVMVGISYYDDVPNKSVRSGELLHIAPDGGVRWRFAFDDRLRFRDGTFTGPWGLTDWQVGPTASPSQIAVAAHDTTWWGSMAAVIDHTGRRISTFVNPGWIESLLWLDRERLAAAGFSNARNAAMLAIVDSRRALTQAPGSDGTPFHCSACPSDAPLFYAIFPRSELNVLTASRFNRAQVAWSGDRLLVTTMEIAGNPLAATALYEFDRDLQLVRARYSDVYWDTHRRLELEGRLTHSRETCPEREGPASVHQWSAAGWQRIPASR